MKFYFVKFGNCKLLATTILVVGLLSGDGVGQDLNSPSGLGNQSQLQRQFQQAVQNRTAIPGIGNSSLPAQERTASTPRNPFSGLFNNSKTPGLDGLKTKTENLDRSNPFSDIFPKQEPSRQNFFQKMNSKSKDFFAKTRGWAKGKGSGTKEKSNETWNKVIRDFNANKLRLNKEEQATIPVQPNFRSAEAIGEPKFRF